jgi:hypothetical protein
MNHLSKVIEAARGVRHLCLGPNAPQEMRALHETLCQLDFYIAIGEVYSLANDLNEISANIESFLEIFELRHGPRWQRLLSKTESKNVLNFLLIIQRIAKRHKR